jgi:F-type H+-transporting ATPase subunit b
MALTMRRLGLAAAPLCVPLLAARPAAAGEGMPQLAFGNPLLTAQVVWLAIIFFTLYLLLSRWALPQVSSLLEMRAATIGTDLDAARAAKLDADAAVAELTKATRDAHAGAQAEIAKAVADAKAAADAENARQNAKLDAQLAEAEQRIGQARSAAMGALGQVATETAQAVVSRLTGGVIGRDAVDRAVADALAARAT